MKKALLIIVFILAVLTGCDPADYDLLNPPVFDSPVATPAPMKDLQFKCSKAGKCSFWWE